jgi:hypothetical protein
MLDHVTVEFPGAASSTTKPRTRTFVVSFEGHLSVVVTVDDDGGGDAECLPLSAALIKAIKMVNVGRECRMRVRELLYVGNFPASLKDRVFDDVEALQELCDALISANDIPF